MMNEEEKRRNERAWNDPPMFSYDQLNKQSSAAVPLNRRYKYPIVDQQLLNNQMYQSQQQPGGYMGNNLIGQTGSYSNQHQYGQQSTYGPQSSLTNPSLAYNQQQQMNPTTYQQAGLQQTTNYPGMSGMAYNQAQIQQLPYATMQNQYQPPQTTALYGQQQQSSLLNQPSVSQPLTSTQLNYQNATQTSTYLPNVPNTSINTSASNQMQTSGVAANYTTAMNTSNQYNQYGQLPTQQMYTQQQQHQMHQQQYPPVQNQYQY